MEYIIDGFNVIKTSFIKKYEKYGIEKGQEFLVYILEKYKKKHPSVEITVVFDGYSKNLSIDYNRRVKIIYSHELTADEKIRKILEQKKNKKNLIVVSDDREIVEFTKILGGNILNVEKFLEIVAPIKKEEKVKNIEFKNIEYNLKTKIEKELSNYYGKKIKKNI